MSSLLTNVKLGNTGVSSLIKSAATLQNEIASYQDKIQQMNFNNNPTSTNLQSYIQYLSKRINTLNATGTVTNASKALSLSNEIKTATVKSTTFNIDMISGQMLAGGATDTTKLNYLVNNVLSNPLIQQSPDLYVKYQNQAYNLQKSIAYQQQVQAIASQTQAAIDLSAQERGYTNAKDALDAQWKQLNDAVANGESSAIKKAFANFSQTMAPIYKAAGIKVPKGAVGDVVTANVGYLLGKAIYSEHAAMAAGPDNPDYQKYINDANSIVQSKNFHDVVANALASSNLFSTSTNVGGATKLVENAITGYRTMSVALPGLQPMTVQVPTTSGNYQTPLDAGVQGGKSTFEQKLKSLGLNIISDKGANIQVAVSDKTAEFIKKQADLSPGSRVTVIPTSKGFEFISSDNNHYGVSFDNRGLGALYKQNTSGNWLSLGGQYGYTNQTQSGKGSPITTRIPPQGFAPSSPNPAYDQVFKSIVSMGPAPNSPLQMSQRAGGGYNFLYHGAPISAARYSQLSGTPFRTLLQNMANKGDTGAKTALNFVGNDYGYNPNMIGGNAGLYNSLVWGAHSQAPLLANMPKF